MSGKRAKPSPWRFLRVALLALVAAVVVSVAVGFFLFFPESGGDRAQDWDIGPVPSSGDSESSVGPRRASSGPTTERTRTADTETASPVAGARSSQTTAATPPASTTVARRDGSAPRPSLAPAAAAPAQPTASQPPTQEPVQPEPAAVPIKDDPGKRKGHHDGRGPNDDRP